MFHVYSAIFCTVILTVVEPFMIVITVYSIVLICIYIIVWCSSGSSGIFDYESRLECAISALLNVVNVIVIVIIIFAFAFGFINVCSMMGSDVEWVGIWVVVWDIVWFNLAVLWCMNG